MATTVLRYPGAERWATAVVEVIGADQDPKTLAAWARSVGVSRGALRTWCYAAHVPPHRALDLARILRLACRAPRDIADPLSLLDVVDPRTVARMLHRGGIRRTDLHAAIGRPMLLLDIQRYVPDALLLTALRAALRATQAGRE